MFSFKMFSDFPPWILSLLARKKGDTGHKSGRIARPPRKISTHSLRRVEQYRKQPPKGALATVRSARRHAYQIKEDRGQPKKVPVSPDSPRVMAGGVLPQHVRLRNDKFDVEMLGLIADAQQIENKLVWDSEKITSEISEDLKAEDEGVIGPAEMAQRMEREHSEQYKKFSIRHENFERALKDVSRPDPAQTLSPRVSDEKGLRERKFGSKISERVFPPAEAGDRNHPKMKDSATVSLQRVWQSRAQKSMLTRLDNQMKNIKDKLNVLRGDFDNELHIKKENYLAQAVQDVNMIAEQTVPSTPSEARPQVDMDADKERRRQEAYFRRQRQLQKINAAPQPKPPKFTSPDSAKRRKKDDETSI